MKYEVYENNGGGVTLAILNDDCEPVALFENWEYGDRGDLADALRELAADPTAWRCWEGDMVERIASSGRTAARQSRQRSPSFTTRSVGAMIASSTATAI